MYYGLPSIFSLLENTPSKAEWKRTRNHKIHNVVESLWKADSQFVCVEVLGPSQPNGVMSSAVSLSNHTFTGQA